MEKLIVGGTTLYRHHCPKCKEYTLNGDRILKCDCGYNGNEPTQITNITVMGREKKKGLKLCDKKVLREKQKNKCYWCGRDMETYILKSGITRKLKPHFDHIVPFSFLQGNPKDNWCLSCDVCNLHKWNFVFESEDKTREFLIQRFNKKIEEGKIKILEDV